MSEEDETPASDRGNRQSPIKKGHRAGRNEVLTAPFRVFPNFIVIGAQKGGTWTLYYNLSRHPDMAPATRKEVHFFDKAFHQGALFYKGHFPTIFDKLKARLKGRAFFTGEASPYYMFHPLVPERMKSMVPRAKLIALLRNPVDRAYSHYQQAVAKGRETLSFEEGIDSEEERLRGETERILAEPEYNSIKLRIFSYVSRGRYAEQLKRWYAHFPREQLLLLRSEDFRKEPAKIFREVCRFLEVPEWEPPAYEEVVMRKYEPMKPETRARLVEYFKPHNQELNELVGRDFGWDR